MNSEALSANGTFETAAEQPDFVADRFARIGVVALATEMTMEPDLVALLPETARLHVSRVVFANPTTPENLRAMAPHIAGSADLILPGVPLAALGFGCTSGSVTIGDGAIDAAFASVRPGVPVTAPARAGVAAFKALGVSRIAVMTPYLAETTAPLVSYFEAAGIEVVRAFGLGVADDRDIARISPEDIAEAAAYADHADAQALFLSCTALGALPLIDDLEARLGKPVVSSNLALGRALCDLAGLPMAATAPGALSRLPPGATCR